MNMRTFLGRALPLLAALPGFTTSLSAEDSGIHIRIPNPVPHIAKGIRHVGNFFSRTARTLESAEAPNELRDDLPDPPAPPKKRPAQRAGAKPPAGPAPSPYPPLRPAAPTRYYEPEHDMGLTPLPSPSGSHPSSGEPTPSASTPVTNPAIHSQEPTHRSMTPTTASPSTPAPQTAAGADAAKPAAPSKPEYAKPAPGRPGLVYLPGATETQENLIDVRGIAPGTKVRDPVSGTIFLVP